MTIHLWNSIFLHLYFKPRVEIGLHAHSQASIIFGVVSILYDLLNFVVRVWSNGLPFCHSYISLIPMESVFSQK